MAEKHKMRRHFHEQLKGLWKTNAWLAEINPQTLQLPFRKGSKFDVPRPIAGPPGFFYRYQLGGFDFVPLVTLPLEAHCHLAVRLHCPTGGSIVLPGGDMDNRLKVLLDSLRMPIVPAELADSAGPGDETLFFCLLADDRLITKLTIESIPILGPCPGGKDYADMFIDVTVRAVTPMVGTIPLLF